jgi:hypothetical protein
MIYMERRRQRVKASANSKMEKLETAIERAFVSGKIFEQQRETEGNSITTGRVYIQDETKLHQVMCLAKAFLQEADWLIHPFDPVTFYIADLAEDVLSDPAFEGVLTMPITVTVANKLTKAQRAERAEKVVSVLRSFSSYTGEFADGSWYNVLSVFGYNAMSDTITVAMPYVSEVLRRRHSKQDKPQKADFVQLTEEEIQRMQAEILVRRMSNM